MRLTKLKLKQLIKEELQNVLKEQKCTPAKINLDILNKHIKQLNIPFHHIGWKQGQQVSAKNWTAWFGRLKAEAGTHRSGWCRMHNEWAKKIADLEGVQSKAPKQKKRSQLAQQYDSMHAPISKDNQRAIDKELLAIVKSRKVKGK